MTISKRDKVDILLAEHSHLWEQMNTRISAGSVSASFISLVLTVFVVAGVQFGYRPIFIAMPLLIGVFVSVEIVRQTYVLALGRYITRLEKKINEIAGEELLIWDSKITLGRIARGIRIVDPYTRRSAFNPIAVSGFMVIVLSIASYIFSAYQGASYLFEQNLSIFAWSFLAGCVAILTLLVIAWYSATYLVPPDRKST